MRKGDRDAMRTDRQYGDVSSHPLDRDSRVMNLKLCGAYGYLLTRDRKRNGTNLQYQVWPLWLIEPANDWPALFVVVIGKVMGLMLTIPRPQSDSESCFYFLL